MGWADPKASRHAGSATTTACILVFSVATCLRADAETSVFPDPGLTNPKFRFHTGGVAAGRPELFADVPDMPGPVSRWRVLEWRKAAVLRPDALRRDDATMSDPLFGVAAYAFAAPGTQLKIYRHDGAYVYELASDGGMIDAAGGSNLFLSAEAVDGHQTLDRAITYSLAFKVARAEVHAPERHALVDGAVLAQAFSGFSLRFRDPSGGAPFLVFMQIGLADSRGAVKTYRGCSTHDGRREVVYNATLPGDPHVAFDATPRTPLRRISYDLNRYLCDVLARPFTCQSQDGATEPLTLPSAAHDFRNWSVREMYVGLETEDTDLRPGSPTHAPQGEVSAAIEIADLRVMRDPTRPFDFAACEP